MNPNDINGFMNMISMINNPNQALQSIMSQNSQFAGILNQARNTNGGIKAYLRQYAKQNNINIQPVLDMLAQRGVQI